MLVIRLLVFGVVLVTFFTNVTFAQSDAGRWVYFHREYGHTFFVDKTTIDKHHFEYEPNIDVWVKNISPEGEEETVFFKVGCKTRTYGLGGDDPRSILIPPESMQEALHHYLCR